MYFLHPLRGVEEGNRLNIWCHYLGLRLWQTLIGDSFLIYAASFMLCVCVCVCVFTHKEGFCEEYTHMYLKREEHIRVCMGVLDGFNT